MLEIARLEVRYGHVVAVRDLSLVVNEGEVTGLIGPNGAGKSTVLNAVFGLVRPTGGSVTFDGVCLLDRRPEAIAALGLSLVPEGRHIFGSLTVEENLEIGTTLRSDRQEAARDLTVMLERFPVLGKYRRTPAARLSGGEQQQLAIARALLNRPKLLMLDEPTLGLAPLMVDQVFAILRELRESGATILLVEQNAVRTLGFADRTYILRSGSLVDSGTRAELESRMNLTAAYLGI